LRFVTADAAQRPGAGLTQAERTAISDRAMLNAAIDLVIEHGTEKTTLAMIGEKAGYSRGLATYRFGSKAGLFDTLCKAISRDWLEYLKRGVGDQTGVDAMCAALDTIRRFVSENPQEGRALQILYAGAASPASEFRDTTVAIHKRQQSDVAEWVRAGQQSGDVHGDADPGQVASNYVSYITGMTYLWLISPGAFDFEQTNEEMKRQLRAALAPD
jgi:AcrR family transcriptional regulator